MRIEEFLPARIAEDEAVARAAALRYGPKWSEDVRFVQFDDDEHNLYVIMDAEGREMMESAELSEWRATAHGARHDPARVLAECEAKRRVIEQAGEATSDRYSVIGEFCVGREETQEAMDTDPGDLILRALAAVYRDHPDYDPAWAI